MTGKCMIFPRQELALISSAEYIYHCRFNKRSLCSGETAMQSRSAFLLPFCTAMLFAVLLHAKTETMTIPAEHDSASFWFQLNLPGSVSIRFDDAAGKKLDQIRFSPQFIPPVLTPGILWSRTTAATSSIHRRELYIFQKQWLSEHCLN